MRKKTSEILYFQNLVMLMCSVVFASSCTSEYDPQLLDKPHGEDVTVPVSLAIQDFENPDGTRAEVAGNDDEFKIHDIWVFQFDAVTGVKLQDGLFIDFDDSSSQTSDNFKVTFKYDKKSRIAIVANTGDKNWIYSENSEKKPEFDNYGTFLTAALPASISNPFVSTDIHDTGIPMFGVSKEIVITSKAFVMVKLQRMFARVDVVVDFNALVNVENFEITKLKYRNIPKYCRLKSLSESDDKAGVYPDGIEWGDYDAGNGIEYSLYMPGNLQGKVAEMESKLTAIPEQIPAKALAIDISIEYGGDVKSHTYTVYPGLDEKNDFNVKRNRIYNVRVKLTKLPDAE